MNTQIRLVTMATLAVMAAFFSSAVAADGNYMANLDWVDVQAAHPVTGQVMHYDFGFKESRVTGLHIRINIPVPAKIHGFDNLKSAVNSDLMVTLTRGHHVYAECTVHSSRSFNLLGSVTFEMDIARIEGELRWLGGVCNVTPWGLADTPGVPEMMSEDMAKAYAFNVDQMDMITLGRAHPM